jgi:ABC-2 type transport system permease protein
MQNIWTIAKRELNAYFVSPIAYVILFITLLTLSIFFYYLEILNAVNSQGFIPDIKVVFQLLVFPLFFLAVPAITMRTLAEENKTGTLELLLTAPVRDWELIVGKWLGSILFFIIILAITSIYPFILNTIVEPGIDPGVVIGGYLGIILLTSAMCAIGVCISSLFNNQIAALFTILGVLILFWIIGIPGQLIEGWGGELLRYLSFSDRYYATFLNGIIELRDVIFFLSFTVLGLFLGAVSLEVRRWK